MTQATALTVHKIINCRNSLADLICNCTSTTEALAWRRQDFVRGGTNRDAKTETPNGVDWVKNATSINTPLRPQPPRISVLSIAFLPCEHMRWRSIGSRNSVRLSVCHTRAL